jgi:divalent metal cation (Fe/Co/Zn/Cd) transporter
MYLLLILAIVILVSIYILYRIGQKVKEKEQELIDQWMDSEKNPDE